MNKIVGLVGALLLVPMSAFADPPRDVVERAAHERLEMRRNAVLACAPAMASFAVDVRFRGDGVVDAAALDRSAPPAVVSCVVNALVGVALPGAVQHGTVVRHVFRAAAPPPPVVQAPTPPPPVVYSPAPPPPVVRAPAPVAPPPPAVPAAPPPVIAYQTNVAPPVAPPAEPMAPPPPPVATVAVAGPEPATTTPADVDEEADAASFSVGRYFLEVLVGGAVGSLLSYGVYSAMCDGDDCFGAALAGLGVNVAATPLAIWGAGTLAGGRGNLLYTYVGGLTAFAGGSSPDDAVVALAIGVILMPFTGALLYELTSSAEANRMRMGLTAGVSPVYSREGLAGATLTIGANL